MSLVLIAFDRSIYLNHVFSALIIVDTPPNDNGAFWFPCSQMQPFPHLLVRPPLYKSYNVTIGFVHSGTTSCTTCLPPLLHPGAEINLKSWDPTNEMTLTPLQGPCILHWNQLASCMPGWSISHQMIPHEKKSQSHSWLLIIDCDECGRSTTKLCPGWLIIGNTVIPIYVDFLCPVSLPCLWARSSIFWKTCCALCMYGQWGTVPSLLLLFFFFFCFFSSFFLFFFSLSYALILHVPRPMY